MKKNYFVLAMIAVMMMFVGCDTEGSDSKDDEQPSAAPQQTQPQQPQQPQPQQPQQPETVTYIFNANGGKWSDDTTANKTFSGTVGETFTKPADPTRTGYHCSWDKAVPSVFDGSDDTFTAQWTVNTYTIVFNANGGEGTMDNLPMTYDVSADLPANTFTKSNYAFKGWATSADGEVVYTDGQEVKDLTTDDGVEVTLYAMWRNPIVGDIAYDDGVYSVKYDSRRTPIGIVFYADGAHGKIMHLSEQSSLRWCLKTAAGYNRTLATSTSDGSGNWQIICDTVSDEDVVGNYPAFEYVNGLGSGWYLPAKDELNAVYTNKTAINTAITVLSNAGVSATSLGTDFYWSSSSYNSNYSNYACGQRFSDGDQYRSGKLDTYSVRAVRAF
ncbi:MAG: InlB B-repeat-containing protein [Spirochaetales bacterium]|nr:InlB B-repeat-containing protein [Spirochaetales bacterium]